MLTRLLLAFLLLSTLRLQAEEHPFVGRWALTLPNGAAGWLGVEEKDAKLSASLLWGGGSVLPVDEATVQDGTLTLTQSTGKGKARRITATQSGDDLKLTVGDLKPDGTVAGKADFAGKRCLPVPPQPDLSKVKFGPPTDLLAGDFHATWEMVHEGDESGWVMKDGILSNVLPNPPVKGHHLGNLRTREEFEDFRITTELRTQPGSNSGVYLRGIYEIQVADTYGKAPDSHNMGALYSRITPSVAAEKPVGEWQTLDITLVDRHVTVILNGQKIIDNQAILGCTGGALTSDESKPGPLMLQGDHTSIDYRNMKIARVLK